VRKWPMFGFITRKKSGLERWNTLTAIARKLSEQLFEHPAIEGLESAMKAKGLAWETESVRDSFCAGMAKALAEDAEAGALTARKTMDDMRAGKLDCRDLSEGDLAVMWLAFNAIVLTHKILARIVSSSNVGRAFVQWFEQEPDAKSIDELRSIAEQLRVVGWAKNARDVYLDYEELLAEMLDGNDLLSKNFQNLKRMAGLHKTGGVPPGWS
jgi:hypothetical protein